MSWPGDPRPEDSPLLRDRLTRLARVTSELVRADTVEAAAKTVVTHGAEAVGAALATMTLLSDDGRTIRLVALSGGLPDDERTWGTFPVTACTPSAEAIRSRERLLVSGADRVAERWPEMRMSDRGA